MSRATLDRPTLETLLSDVGACHDLAITQRDGTPIDLAAVLPLLDAGTAVQLRYGHDGYDWWDTLMPRPQGVELIRVRHTF